MLINELIKKVKMSADNRTPEDRARMLREARILDDNGFFDNRYFSKETIEKDKNNNAMSR